MRNPNARSLALRDQAQAALIGAIRGGDFGADGYGAFGSWPGGPGTFGADLAPTAENMAQALREKIQTRQRESILNPNMGSDAKVQRYCFALNQALVLGTAAVLNLTGNPQTYFRPQRVTVNAPCQQFATLQTLQVANVGVLVGGTVDAWDFNALGQDQALDVPTISPANAAQATGNYSGFVPAPFVGGAAYTLTVSFKGPANMVA